MSAVTIRRVAGGPDGWRTHRCSRCGGEFEASCTPDRIVFTRGKDPRDRGDVIARICDACLRQAFEPEIKERATS